MKKFLLYFTLILCALNANAQVTLNNSPYTENFDNIGSGMPEGFSVYTGATSPTAIGSVATFSSNITPWSTTVAGFYNCASATGLTNATNAAEQESSSNRALAVRQTSSFGNPGAAFVFKIANTTNKTGFNLSFKLQTLDSATQGITVWSADYGFGSNPTSFTQAIITPETSRTGGKKGTDTYIFNNSLSINFGTALDNKNDVVWIRLRAPLSTSNITLSQIYNALGITNTNPTMSGIDDWNLSWTDNTPPPPDPTSVSNLNTLANTYTSRMIGNSIQVKFNKGYASPTIIRLTDMNGAIIWQKQYPTIKAEQVEWISSGLLSKGIYLLQIQNREGQGTQRIAK